MSDAELAKLYAHPMVCELTRSELATTDSGSSMGERLNGDGIANNLFIAP